MVPHTVHLGSSIQFSSFRFIGKARRSLLAVTTSDLAVISKESPAGKLHYWEKTSPAVHVNCPTVDWYLPFAQATQSDSPAADGCTRPNGQSSQPSRGRCSHSHTAMYISYEEALKQSTGRYESDCNVQGLRNPSPRGSARLPSPSAPARTRYRRPRPRCRR